MKVLITGASGKLGAYVIRALAQEYELVLMSRSRPDSEFSLFPWISGDLANWDDCRRAVDGVDAIQHIGAQPWPTDHPAMKERVEEEGLPFDATFRSNLLGTYYLMQAAVEAGVKTVVMAGSNCALGHGFRISDTPFPVDFLPINETHPTFPEDSYSYAKRAGEDLLASFSRSYGIRTYVTRIAGVCPPERRRQMASQASPATAWNPWLYCWVGSEDVAGAHRLLMEAAPDLPVHDVYFLNADDTTALETDKGACGTLQPTACTLGCQPRRASISAVQPQTQAGGRLAAPHFMAKTVTPSLNLPPLLTQSRPFTHTYE